MDKYTRAIMTLIKNVFENVVGVRPYQTESEARTYYLKKLDDNLYKPMDEVAQKAYGQGTGNEIASGKMNALRSSSALTYNLFWNRVAKFNNVSTRIGSGCYSVEFEKQFHPLKNSVSNVPANLDAFLYCEDNGEAIACEMKMMEWIFNKPGTLKSKYLTPSNYINEDVGSVFADIAKKLMQQNDNGDPSVSLEEYPCKMKKYDAFQMFKHAVACYSACAGEKPRKIKKLTLVNCVWTLSIPQVLEQKHCEKYLKEEKCEREEFEQFKKIMEPVKVLFKAIDVDFDLCFYSLNEFLSLMEKNEDELNYLRRYTLR